MVDRTGARGTTRTRATAVFAAARWPQKYTERTRLERGALWAEAVKGSRVMNLWMLGPQRVGMVAVLPLLDLGVALEQGTAAQGVFVGPRGCPG